MYVDFNLGRKARRLYREAGFTEVEVQAYVASAEQGSLLERDRKSEGNLFLNLTDRSGPAQNILEAVLQRGLLSPEQLNDARLEAQVWSDNPDALHFSASVFVRGRVD
ncbi:hypothetical protein ES703_85640 [subsurface metagenome]